MLAKFKHTSKPEKQYVDFLETLIYFEMIKLIKEQIGMRIGWTVNCTNEELVHVIKTFMKLHVIKYSSGTEGRGGGGKIEHQTFNE